MYCSTSDKLTVRDDLPNEVARISQKIALGLYNRVGALAPDQWARRNLGLGKNGGAREEIHEYRPFDEDI